MEEIDDVVEMSKKIMKEMDAALEDVENLHHETDNFYSNLGIERNAAEKYLNSEKIPLEQKEKIKKELDQWRDEIDRDVNLAMNNAKQGRPTPRKRKNRQFI